MSSNTFGYIADTGPTQAFGNLPRKYNPIPNPPVLFTVNYLVVAGGGGARYYFAGGGGAGGLRSSVTNTGGGGSVETGLILETGIDYTITIGAGGANLSNEVIVHLQQ